MNGGPSCRHMDEGILAILSTIRKIRFPISFPPGFFFVLPIQLFLVYLVKRSDRTENIARDMLVNDGGCKAVIKR